MKSFDELLENLPQEKALSSEEKEKILSLAMQKIAVKPKKRQIKIRYLASVLAAGLVLITVIAVPFTAQKKNLAQDAKTESAAPPSYSYFSDEALNETAPESFAQTMCTEAEDATEDSIIPAQDTEEATDDIVQEEAPVESPESLFDAAPEAMAPQDTDVDAYMSAPQTENVVVMNSAQSDFAAAPEAAPSKPEEDGADAAAEVTEDVFFKSTATAQPSGSVGGGGGGGSSAGGGSAVKSEVIADTETYRSVKHVIHGEPTYENTHKLTNRVLTLSELFPTGYDYKKELSLTGDELFYITEDDHLIIITASGELDAGVLIDGKIQK